MSQWFSNLLSLPGISLVTMAHGLLQTPPYCIWLQNSPGLLLMGHTNRNGHQSVFPKYKERCSLKINIPLFHLIYQSNIYLVHIM